MLEAAKYSADERLRDGRHVEIRALRPEVLPDNVPMLSVFKKAGFHFTGRASGVVYLTLRLH